MIRLLAVCLMLAACGGTTAYTGTAAAPVVGTLPPPPPPVVKQAPPAPPSKVAVHEDRIDLAEKIQFELDQATIQPVSFPLLDEVVATFKQHPQIKKVSIDGFASSDGTEARNQWLSGARAKAVMAYLVEHGVDPARLTAQGHGTEKPIADNSTPEGREQNRRVELKILEQDPTASGATASAVSTAATPAGTTTPAAKTPATTSAATPPATAPATTTPTTQGEAHEQPKGAGQ